MKQTTAMPMLRVQTPMAASHALVIPVTAEMVQTRLVVLMTTAVCKAFQAGVPPAPAQEAPTTAPCILATWSAALCLVTHVKLHKMAQHALVTLIFMAQLVCLLLLQHVTYYPTAHI